MGIELFSLIIPTYNEARNILPLLQNVHHALGSRPHEVIVVDDASPDGTGDIVKAFSLEHPYVRLVVRENERGLSGAVIRGIEESRGSILGVIDGDQSHDERILPQLLAAVESGADLAVGSRRIPGGGADYWPWYRRLTSSLATLLAKSVLHVRLSDPMSGYFVMKRALYVRCQGKLMAGGYKILLEIYCKTLPTAVTEIPYVFRDRTQGHSKISLRVLLLYLISLSQLRKDVA